MALQALMVVAMEVTTKVLERLKQRCIEQGQCWVWQGRLTWNGYGQVKVDGKCQRAHRVAFKAANGYDAHGDVDHKCRNRACVNPDHLQDMPASANRRDGALWQWSQYKRDRALLPQAA